MMLICISLMISNVKHLFMQLLVVWMSFLEKISVSCPQLLDFFILFIYLFFCYLYEKFFRCIYFGRDREKESQADCGEPNAGLEPMNREIMTSANIKSWTEPPRHPLSCMKF